MFERIELGISDFMIEDFENSHMKYMSSLIGRSADRWNIHFILVWLMLIMLLPTFTFIAVVLILSDITFQSSYVLFTFNEDEEEDWDNLILAFNKMVENMGGDIRFRFETFVMYNKLGYVMWKQDVSTRITDKLFDISLMSKGRFKSIYRNGHDLYEIRNPFKYSRLIIWTGDEFKWGLGRKYNYTYQFKHVRLYRELVRKIIAQFRYRRRLYVSYIKLTPWDLCYPLNKPKLTFKYLRKYYYYNNNSSLFWVDFMEEFKLYCSENTIDNIYEMKYLSYHYDFVFVLLVCINRDTNWEVENTEIIEDL